jgi:hypothetical protein
MVRTSDLVSRPFGQSVYRDISLHISNYYINVLEQDRLYLRFHFQD